MNPIIFSKTPRILTKNLVIRFLNSKDYLSIFKLQTNEANHFYLDRQKMLSIVEAKEFIENKNQGIDDNQWFYWGICPKGSDTVVGTICLWSFSKTPYKAEVGYELLPDFQRKGIMNEALSAIIDFGFRTLGLEYIEAYTRQNNLGSIHLLEKNNFSFVKTLKEEEKTEIEQESKIELVLYHLARN